VPPSGEADEIGRLTFAFEEMRRALRDKLRSTESLNIDLEREVRRSTEAAATAAADAQQMLAVVQRGAARSKAIVQALHNYSRGDEQRPRELVVARSVDDTLDLLRHRLRNVRVEKQIDPELRLHGFPGQIDQVFMNLISNAAQAVGERDNGGTIRIAAQKKADDVEITVADDGPGIPADVIPKIFDPFFTTKDVGEGSGLGLSIVHGIVDRHGGRIMVESQVGAGTTFRIVLPVRASAPVGTSPPS